MQVENSLARLIEWFQLSLDNHFKSHLAFPLRFDRERERKKKAMYGFTKFQPSSIKWFILTAANLLYNQLCSIFNNDIDKETKGGGNHW